MSKIITIDNLERYVPFQNEHTLPMVSVDATSCDPQYFLGRDMAEKEWSADPEYARERFLHVGAYKQFYDDDHFILLGRTGTGKTSIIKCVENDIQQQRAQAGGFTDAILLDSGAVCKTLASSCKSVDIRLGDALYQIRDSLLMFVKTQVMLHIYNLYDGAVPQAVKLYLEKFHLVSTKLTNAKRTVEKVLDTVIGEVEGGDITDNKKVLTGVSVVKILRTAQKIVKDEIEVGFDSAYQEMTEFLQKNNRKVLLLLDSFLEYNISDPAVIVATKAIIAACFNIYSSAEKDMVHFKIALPSEIYTRVITHLPGKHMGNTVVIKWTYNELINCMALRLITWVKSLDRKDVRKALFSFADSYDANNFGADDSETQQKSHELFTHIFPLICKTCIAVDFFTLAFIIRHTMKKPREVLLLFNSLLGKIVETQKKNYFLDNPNEIKEIVHSEQETLVNQVLSMYEVFLPGIGEYCSELLNNMHFIFTLNDRAVSEKLKLINAKIAKKNVPGEFSAYFDGFDIFRLLLETGLIGQVNEVRVVQPNGQDPFRTEAQLKIVNAIYEYQIKGTVHQMRDIQYVVHPMCYEHFRCGVGEFTLVNPDSYDKSEPIMSILRRD